MYVKRASLMVRSVIFAAFLLQFPSGPPGSGWRSDPSPRQAQESHG
jgi:hypothetical protein